ncbi:unnamed protein product [Urochloa decumbens]|uniref:Uncharacterized protein n=1 Tax=Urochloa decumbens TaxID=240449 RepID=A0ABC8XYL9_9POAL
MQGFTIPSEIMNVNVGGAMASNVIPSTTDPFERRRQRDRDRYAQMPTQQKEELLKKRRENYQRNKIAAIKDGVECHQLLDLEMASNDENIAPEMHQMNNPKETPSCNNENLIIGKKQRQGLTDEQIESRRARDRARYANMTPKQRQAIRDRQNARNMKPEQKQAKRDNYKACRELRKNTLHKDSIAIANPFYNRMDDSP